jgi:DNA polymerase III subunit epsilon
MREIVLDTETTGFKPEEGHRLVEIGAVELFNHLPTGQVYHQYINPERDVPKDAEQVHGLSTAFLKDKPVFSKIAGDFLAFIGEASLIIHNASFDMAFINSELAYIGENPVMPGRVIDTLQLARQKYPMGPNSLDALCKRFAIDNSKRIKHGALLDSELLAEVYLELIGGRQTTFGLTTAAKKQFTTLRTTLQAHRPQTLESRLSDTERAAHEAMVKTLGENALWLKYDA